MSDPVRMLLPAVAEETDLIEVVRITALMSSHRDKMIGEDIDLWEADEALALIADLPIGELARCFVPAYGIRAHGAAGLLFEIAFCFHCHGALLMGPSVPAGQRGIQGFDADSVTGRELLRRFKACEQV